MEKRLAALAWKYGISEQQLRALLGDIDQIAETSQGAEATVPVDTERTHTPEATSASLTVGPLPTHPPTAPPPILPTVPPTGPPTGPPTHAPPDGQASGDPAEERPERSDEDFAEKIGQMGVLPIRMDHAELIGRGGMGEVYRVDEPLLDRRVALKLLLPHLSTHTGMVNRFIREAMQVARLQHPGIVPLHCLGMLPNGRVGFTMLEVQGRTLREAMKGVQEVSRGSWRPDRVHSWTFRSLIDAFHRVCETMAYAHSKLVLHLDLKPDNVMLGAFGEVFVMDWGLTYLVPVDPLVPEAPAPVGRDVTHVRGFGTPWYLSPEQARGDRGRLKPASDVFSLGAMLFEILCGYPPIPGDQAQPTLQAAARGELLPLKPLAPVPAELIGIAERCLSFQPADRYPSARELADEIGGWLKGTRQLEEALKLVARSDQLLPQVRARRALAAQRRREAAAWMTGVAPSAPLTRKRPAWALEDEADRLEKEARSLELQSTQQLQAALNLVSTLPEADDRLAQIYWDQLCEAERAGDEAEAERAEALLHAHNRGGWTERLRGLGEAVIHTDPPGASVSFYRYVQQDRRLEPVLDRVAGAAPLAAALPHGSYVALLTAPGYEPVRYPILINRFEAWDGVPPGATAPLPIRLPPAGALGEGAVYVPAGWFTSGGDPDASDPLRRERWWVDGFVCSRYPVTNREYLEFLNDLVAQGRASEAEQHQPRRMTSPTEGVAIYAQNPDRTFAPGGQPAQTLQQPVVCVSWGDAAAYTAWLRARSDRPWRLLHELEVEKAARGVDARFYPWGRFFDAIWSCVYNSSPGVPNAPTVGTFTTDVSPYGVYWLAGGASTWCINPYHRSGEVAPGNRLILPPLDVPPVRTMATRGASWMAPDRYARVAGRFAGIAAMRYATVGFRVGYSFG